VHLDLEAGVVALGLLGAVAAMLAFAPTLRIPYPILLVLGGLAIGVIPGMPNVELEPELIFYGVLPPLLYSAAFFTSLRDLRANVRPRAPSFSPGPVCEVRCRSQQHSPCRSRPMPAYPFQAVT
jgi:hypothetical protein